MEKPSRMKTGNPFVESGFEAVSVLDSIDWNFSSKSFIHEGMKPFDCRKHHWFPATFIPQIPYTLIEMLTHVNATVCDPFAGIGTTYFQALLLNRRALATENCQIAVEFMKSLLVLFNPKIDFKSIGNIVRSSLQEYSPNIDYVKEICDTPSINALFCELKKWYHRNTLNQLAFLTLIERNCKDSFVRAAMRISISSVLKRANSQSKSWGHIADNVIPKEDQIKDKNAISMFLVKLNSLLKDLSEHLRLVTPEYYQLYQQVTANETIFHTDARKDGCIPDNSIDLIVTSPPYPKMTDYVKSQRLSYYWLGMTLSNGVEGTKDTASEIGARRKRSHPGLLQEYFDDLKIVNEILSRKIRDGGYVCFVMPMFGSTNQNDTERRHIVQKVISDLENYFIKERELERTIPAIRRAHNIKWSTLEREKIYIFRKGNR